MSFIFSPESSLNRAFCIQRLALVAGSSALRGRPLLVLRAMAKFVNSAGECWPSRECLAGATALGLHAVDSALDELDHLGLIQRRRKFRRVIYSLNAEVIVRHVDRDLHTFRVETSVLDLMSTVAEKIGRWTAVAVFLAVGRRRHQKPVTMSQIAAFTGLGVNSARAALAALERDGLVAVTRPENGSCEGLIVRVTGLAPGVKTTPPPNRVYTKPAPAPMGEAAPATPPNSPAAPSTNDVRPLHQPKENSIRTLFEESTHEGSKPVANFDRTMGLRKIVRPLAEAEALNDAPSDLVWKAEALEAAVLKTEHRASVDPNQKRCLGLECLLREVELALGDAPRSQAEKLNEKIFDLGLRVEGLAALLPPDPEVAVAIWRLRHPLAPKRHTIPAHKVPVDVPTFVGLRGPEAHVFH